MLLIIRSQQLKIPDKQDYYQYNWVFYDESYVIEDLFNVCLAAHVSKG